MGRGLSFPHFSKEINKSQVLSEIKVIDDLKDIVGDVVTKKAKTKHMLEEQIRDIAPIEFEEETDEKI